MLSLITLSLAVLALLTLLTSFTILALLAFLSTLHSCAGFLHSADRPGNIALGQLLRGFISGFLRFANRLRLRSGFGHISQ